jgi:hypothetical protein
MGLFDFLLPENGPCSDCEHSSGSECRRFYEESYSRIHGTTRTYDALEEARSSSGFCGHRGKYWTQRDYRSPEEKWADQMANSISTGEGKRGNW